MDGEDSLIDVELIDEHVAGCVACQTWAAAAVVVGRRLRVREAVAGPDLSEAIVAAAESGEPGRRSGRGDAVVRWALGFVAFVQLSLGLAQLLGVSQSGMSMGTGDAHLFNESTAWNIAVAIGLLVAAAWPRLARGFLPVLAVFVAVLTIVSVGDAVSGRVGAGRLETHAFVVVGLGLLFLVDRRMRRLPTPAGAQSLTWTDDEVLTHGGPSAWAQEPDRAGPEPGRGDDRRGGLRPAGRRAA